MDPTVAGAYKPLESNDLDSSCYGPKAKAEREMWFALRKVAINILRHWGAHIPERGKRINADAMLTLVHGRDWTSYLSGSMERRSSVLQIKCRQRSIETDRSKTTVGPTTRAPCRRKADATGTSPLRTSLGWQSMVTWTGSRSCELFVRQQVLQCHDGCERDRVVLYGSSTL
jgi:hypothetical protein